MRSAQRRRLLFGVGGAIGAALAVRGAAAQAPREIDVVAQRFRFTPDEIKLKAGERVVLLVRSLDFVHGFSVPALGLRSDLMPGRVTRIELLAPQPGTLDFLCDNFCGDHHEDMHGRFIVSR